LNPQALRLHGANVLGHPVNGLTEFGRQAFPRHLEEVEARRARRRLEVRGGLPAELAMISMSAVHHDASRRIRQEETVASFSIAAALQPASCCCVPAGRGRSVVGG